MVPAWLHAPGERLRPQERHILGIAGFVDGGVGVVPVATLAAEPLLLSEEERAPEFNQFVIELCRSVGFIPTLYKGTVDSIRASVDLVAQQRCVLCAPSSCLPTPAGIVWRPLIAPLSRYPWSVLWRAGDSSEHVRTLVRAARTLSQQLGLLQPALAR